MNRDRRTFLIAAACFAVAVVVAPIVVVAFGGGDRRGDPRLAIRPKGYDPVAADRAAASVAQLTVRVDPDRITITADGVPDVDPIAVELGGKASADIDAELEQHLRDLHERYFADRRDLTISAPRGGAGKYEELIHVMDQAQQAGFTDPILAEH